jgi:hypothetical protein
MNFYIGLIILALSIGLLVLSIKKEWELGVEIGVWFGLVWLIFGVIILPLSEEYTTEITELTEYQVECTSRVCQVSFDDDLIEIEDAYRYNKIAGNLPKTIILTTEYNWWGYVIHKKIDVK